MEISPQLIEKFLNNECSADEADAVLEWYNSFDNEEDPLELLSEAQQEQLKAKMLARIRLNIEAAAPVRRQPFLFRRRWYAVAGVAASLALIFSIFFSRPLPNDVALNTVRPLTDSIIINNLSRKIMLHVLPDGSSVWLQPSSSISYHRSFGAKQRELSLNGESFFDVKRDSIRPFVIHTGSLSTKVLGTSFNIKAFDNAEVAEVSVLTGKVQVYSEDGTQGRNQSVYLLPEQKAVYVKASKKIAQQKEAGAKLKKWEKSSFWFDNVPVSSVVRALEDKFQVTIEVPDQTVANYILKADFSEERLPVILEMMSKSLDINYEVTEDKIVLNRNFK